MKLNKLVLAISLFALLAFASTSQIPQAAAGISVEELKNCKTIFYDKVQPIYSNCIYYNNYTLCLNTSGANTDCSLQQSQKTFKCQTDEIRIQKNKAECTPLNRFVVSIYKGLTLEKKEIDFSSWGACVQTSEDGCVVVLCGSQHGGSAVNGIFNGCDGGKSCQKFLFCPNGMKVLYKGSGERFVSEDPTFHLSKLDVKEVGK